MSNDLKLFLFLGTIVPAAIAYGPASAYWSEYAYDHDDNICFPDPTLPGDVYECNDCSLCERDLDAFCGDFDYDSPPPVCDGSYPNEEHDGKYWDDDDDIWYTCPAGTICPNTYGCYSTCSETCPGLIYNGDVLDVATTNGGASSTDDCYVPSGTVTLPSARDDSKGYYSSISVATNCYGEWVDEGS